MDRSTKESNGRLNKTQITSIAKSDELDIHAHPVDDATYDSVLKNLRTVNTSSECGAERLCLRKLASIDAAYPSTLHSIGDANGLTPLNQPLTHHDQFVPSLLAPCTGTQDDFKLVAGSPLLTNISTDESPSQTITDIQPHELAECNVDEPHTPTLPSGHLRTVPASAAGPKRTSSTVHKTPLTAQSARGTHVQTDGQSVVAPAAAGRLATIFGDDDLDGGAPRYHPPHVFAKLDSAKNSFSEKDAHPPRKQSMVVSPAAIEARAVRRSEEEVNDEEVEPARSRRRIDY